MVYLIYKDDSEREFIKNNFAKINDFVYKDDSKLASLYKKLILVNHSAFNNKDLIDKVDDNKFFVHDEGNNLYYKFYTMNDEDKLKTMIRLTTSINSSKGKYKDFYIFYDSLNDNIYNEMTGNEPDSSMLSEMTKYALVAFSTRYDIYDNNDLLNGFMYDQDALQEKYDKVMGDREFDKLNHYCYMQQIDYSIREIISPHEFYKITDSLKNYFYKRMNQINDISLEEKKAMMENFNFIYENLKNKQIKNNKKMS